MTSTDVAIIGAGPYGLSLAAHLRARGVEFRIFGRPMHFWRTRMPRGMLLKSDGFASDLFDPDRAFTLARWCREAGVEYDDLQVPVRLETFCNYGLAFQQRYVRDPEPLCVASLEPASEGFALTLEDGRRVGARRVVIAVGLSHFAWIPPVFANLPAESLTHSSAYGDPAALAGRDVAIVGGGASAIDLAVLAHEAGARVRLVARAPALKFNETLPPPEPRPLWQRLRNPRSGLGLGLRSWLCSEYPGLFRHLPQQRRLHIVRTHLGPSASFYMRQRLIGRVTLLLGRTPVAASAGAGKVRLRLRDMAGGDEEIVVDHVVAATGYRVDLGRLPFLAPDLRARIAAVEAAPVLSARCESTVPGLYFVGLAAANSFGPVMRFAWGARWAAPFLARVLSRR